MRFMRSFAAVCAAIAFAGVGQATVLIFENAAGTPLTTFDFDGQDGPNYGDRVTSATQDGFSYGDAFGWTPNVTAHYSTNGNHVVGGWSTGYGSLVNVIWGSGSSSTDQSTYTIRLVADADWFVTFHGFKGGTWSSGAGAPIPEAILRNSNGDIVWRYSDESGDQWPTIGNGWYEKSFANPLIDTEFSLEVYQGWWHAIDDVAFGQTPVPEPATLLALGAGAAALAARRRRKA